MLFFLGVLFGAWKANRFGYIDPQAFRRQLAIGGLLALAYGVGAWKVMVQPFLWTLLLAALVTVNLALSLLQGSGNLLMLGVELFLAAATWSALAGVARMVRLIRKHPDLRISRTLVVERGRLRELKAPRHKGPYGEVASRARARVKAGRWRFAAGIGVVAGVIVLLVLLRSGVEHATTPALADTAQRFCEAWNQEGPASEAASRLSRFFGPGEATVMAARLARRFRIYGWTGRLPRISGPTLRPEGIRTRSSALFCFPDLGLEAPLETAWELVGDHWQLQSLTYPKGLRERPDR